MRISTRLGRLKAVFVFSLCLTSFASFCQSPVDVRDTLGRLADEERRRTQDPATGRVPYERLDEARRQLIQQVAGNGSAPQAVIPGVTWQERGPSNSGGRTRALLFDPADAARKKVWAGSVAGGLWYTNDITDANAGWTPVSDNWESTVVTALAAHPGNPQIMYAGTGDTYDYRPGGGIWKTTDAGQTWTRLSSTVPGGNAPAVSRAFDFVQRIVVNTSGHVFVATQYGVVRSTDGGSNWSYVLAPAQAIGVGGAPTGNYYNDRVTDLEIGSDDILYVAFYPSRVFRAIDAGAASWTEITPPGTSGERTELALAPSTSGGGQILYGASRAYNSTNYGQDIRWFKKSTNGGASWTDVVIPTDSYGNHFTNGNGYYALSLAVHPTNPNWVYAGGNNWYRSTDGGATWSGQLLNLYSPNQHALLFQPANNAFAAFGGDLGVFVSPDWGSTATTPTLTNKNNGYRAGEVSSVAMKGTPGSPYLLTSVRPMGVLWMGSAGIAAGNPFFGGIYSQGLTFIDEDEPNNQLFESSGYYYRYDGNYVSFIGSLAVNRSFNPADYDSQANTLYAAESDDSKQTYLIRKFAGIGSTVTSTTLTLSGLTSAPTFLQLGKDRTALFVGNYPGKLYKVTNLGQPTPTTTAIDNGAFPQYSTISGIDVGADDNELLVTLSNYGVQSVWYTRDGGQSWTGKDQSNYGLPDMPIRGGLFNPQNRKQVLLATELGVWSTTDITAANPAWAFTGSGLGTIRINQLRYRASDGRVAAATAGRGIFTTDALAIPYTVPTVAITGVSNATLCAGSQFTVSFSTNGPAFGTGNRFDLYVSDASGSFTNPTKIGSGTSSPISVTLSTGYGALPYGTNYRLKIVATNPEVESGVSDPLAIGNLSSVNITDRRGTGTIRNAYTSGTICQNSRATITAFSFDGSSSSTSVESYQWLLNGTFITGATSSTLAAQKAGNYQAIVRQAGCSLTSGQYQLDVSNSIYSSVLSPANDLPQCSDHPLTVTAYYIGETATYQWTRDGAAIAGATAYSLVASQSGFYAHQITDGACTVTSSSRYLQFGPSLYAHALLAGDSILCSASASGGQYLYADQISGPASYTPNLYSIQWYRDNVPVSSSGTGNMYYYPYQAGAYSFVLTQGSCQTRSNAVVIGASNQINAAIDYTYPDRSACPGESRTLYANPSFNANFQWQRDGADIAGATSYNYVAQQSGSYTVRITRGSCSATSVPLSLTFSNSIQPKIYFYGTSAEVCSNLYLYASGSQSGYTYQWFRDGAPVGNNSSLNVVQTGLYSVRVTNGSCTGLSKVLYVKTGQNNKPTVSLNQPINQVCAGNSVRLTATSTDGGYYQWKRNGVAIPSVTANQCYATQAGLYSVAVNSGTGCQTESDPVEIKIGEPTTATLGGNALVEAGKPATLPVSFTGPAPWSFTLTNGQSVQNTYQNPYPLTVAPIATTTYALASVQNGCGFGTTSGNAVVTVGSGSADVSLTTRVSNRTPNVGDVVEYALTLTNAGPQDAVGVQVSSRLPTGLAFVEAVTPGVTFADGQVRGDAGTIAANSTAVLRYRARATQPGVFATAAQVTATQTPDPDSQPNSGTGDGQDDAAQTDLRAANGSGSVVTSDNPNQIPLPPLIGNQPVADLATADLSLTLSVAVAAPKAGDVVNVSLRVSNRGGSSASSVALQTLLPDGWQLADATGLAVNGQTVTGYINAIPAGGSATLALAVRVANTGLLKAQIADVAEADPDSTPGNGYTNGEDDEASAGVRVR